MSDQVPPNDGTLNDPDHARLDGLFVATAGGAAPIPAPLPGNADERDAIDDREEGDADVESSLEQEPLD